MTISVISAASLVTTSSLAFATNTFFALTYAKGKSMGEMAVAVGVDPLLFERIDSGRQPLWEGLVDPIAVFLGATRSEVLGAVRGGILKNVPGTSVGTANRPLPPSQILGEASGAVVMNPTIEIIPEV